MRSLIVFLNELSFVVEDYASLEQIRVPVLSTLAAISSAKRIRRDLIVAGNVRLSGVLVGDGTRSLGEVLQGNDYRDEWRLLYSLDQLSPWDAYPGSARPTEFQEVRFQGRVAVGMLWAKENESIVLSFAFSPSWESPFLHAQFLQMNDDMSIVDTEVQVANLSRIEHVTTHRDLIVNFGLVLATSSRVYVGDGFEIRMFFDDHDPPHFHVFGSDGGDTVARYAIQTLDRLSGELSPAIGRKVTQWAETRREDLMTCWYRCRRHQYPLSLRD